MGQHNHNHNSSKNLKVAFFLNLGFTLIEIFGAFYTNSLAILSDAIHDLGDSLSLGMSWFFENISKKKPNNNFSYGFKRFSLLGAIINSIFLLIGSVFVIFHAIPRIIDPEVSDAKGMMWFAILGIIVNGAAVVKLKEGKTLNEKVVSLHLLEDVLGWVAVLIVSIFMQFYDIPILDPILSVIIACYILFNVYKNTKESIQLVLQATPKNLSIENIKTEISGMSEVSNIHDCHIWSMDGDYHVLTAHVQLVDKSFKLEETITIKNKIKALLHTKFKIDHITLELENDEDCDYKDCY